MRGQWGSGALAMGRWGPKGGTQQQHANQPTNHPNANVSGEGCSAISLLKKKKGKKGRKEQHPTRVVG